MTETARFDADTLRLASRLIELNESIARLNAEAEGIKSMLRALPPGDYANDQGTPIVRIMPNRRFDAEKGLSLLPEELREGCYKRVADPTLVREYLAPKLAEACMVEVGKAKVVPL